MSSRSALALAVSVAVIGGGACPTKPKPVRPTSLQCLPRCKLAGTCNQLDDKLVASRKPMLACVGKQAHAGRLHLAHRCYRALRLIESARWWLRTLTSEDALLPRTYRVAVDTMRQAFLCRIEQLADARTAAEVETLYLELVRAFP